MTKDETKNLSTFERVVRVILGIAVFLFGLEISNIIGALGSGAFAQGSLEFAIASNIDRFRNIYRELAWFFGFVLFFTGSTGFCPFYKIVSNLLRKK
jgi:hypothetical protein